jgi:3-oxoacyl-[acyl-carrier-protein] synthase-3
MPDAVPHAVIIGSGSEISGHRITNDAMARIMDTSDAWIRERTGVEARYFVEPGTSTTDLAVPAARRALEAAQIDPSAIDLVVFATMTPDHFFPGNGGLLQARLGLRPIPCFDIRQQCSGFLYGLQLADAHIRAGMARMALLVGAEVHSGFMPWSEGGWARLAGDADAPLAEGEWERNSAVRHLAVLFGDGAAAVVVSAQASSARGVIDHELAADGTNADKLWVPGVGFRHRPYVDADMIARGETMPTMDGRYVFKMASTKMAEAAHAILQRNGFGVDDLSMVLMHQANRRINEFVQKMLRIPDDKVAHNIERYGNTTAATIPLLWDECVRGGRISSGDLVLMVGFGAGMTWGASLLRA